MAFGDTYGATPDAPDRDAALSPAARAIVGGAWFGQTSDVEEVEDRRRVGPDPLDDMLMVNRHRDETDAHVVTVTTITVRRLESLIARDRIGFIMGPGAREYNRTRGWRAPGRRSGPEDRRRARHPDAAVAALIARRSGKPASPRDPASGSDQNEVLLARRHPHLGRARPADGRPVLADRRRLLQDQQASRPRR